MPTNADPLSQTQAPLRVFYATGRMLGVEDFQAEQTYHRGRLARVLVQALGSGTVSGLKVQSNNAADPLQVELQVTAGLAIDRAGRIIESPTLVCIRMQAFLDRQSDTDLSDAFKSGAGNLVADVFATFKACDRGKTPSFATTDDYDATDAFVANRVLDSLGVQLVLRKEATPPLPRDPWQSVGPLRAPGSAAPDPTAAALKQHILDSDAGPADNPVEYPSDPTFDRTSVFLARVGILGSQAAAGARPSYDVTQLSIDNLSRLFLYPAALVSRWVGLTTGKE
jgi:hypothetical protein